MGAAFLATAVTGFAEVRLAGRQLGIFQHGILFPALSFEVMAVAHYRIHRNLVGAGCFTVTAGMATVKRRTTFPVQAEFALLCWLQALARKGEKGLDISEILTGTADSMHVIIVQGEKNSRVLYFIWVLQIVLLDEGFSGVSLRLEAGKIPLVRFSETGLPSFSIMSMRSFICR